MKLKKGDTVIVIAGKDKGKKGKILKVNGKVGKVTVERVNIAKKHQKPTRNFQGGIIEKVVPILASKVMLVCPRCSEPAKVSKKEINGKFVRACKSCSEIIDKV